MIALVQRPRRKIHAASLQDAGWITLCDRVVLVEGTAALPVGDDAIEVAEQHPGAVCVDCHRILLMADVMTRAALTRLQLAA